MAPVPGSLTVLTHKTLPLVYHTISQQKGGAPTRVMSNICLPQSMIIPSENSQHGLNILARILAQENTGRMFFTLFIMTDVGTKNWTFYIYQLQLK
jgi:hypothetical protein